MINLDDTGLEQELMVNGWVIKLLSNELPQHHDDDYLSNFIIPIDFHNQVSNGSTESTE